METIYKILESIRPESNFKNSENFIDDGLLDSFDIVSLVNELEEAYDILVDALDILPDNFSSLEAIKALIVKSGGTIEN